MEVKRGEGDEGRRGGGKENRMKVNGRGRRQGRYGKEDEGKTCGGQY